MELKDKKIIVVGLGKSGLAAAALLNELGAKPKVTDNRKDAEVERNTEELSNRGIPFELGSHTEDFMSGSDLMVVSPGVSDESFAIKWAESKKIPIISEIELAYILCKAPIIAITGTNGKSTVTSLTGEIFKNSKRKTAVCGNIGTPFCDEVLKTDKDWVVVLEISSFQLERIASFKPKVSFLLNVTQDHLDRYLGMEQYFNAKKRIFLNQDETDYAILNFDSPRVRALKGAIKPGIFYFSRYRLSKEYDGAYIENGEILIRRKNKFLHIASQDNISLEGSHNLQNCLASILAAFIFDIPADSIKETLSKFKPLPHRFETVDIIDGVRFIDDSKATNVDGVIKALECCRSPVVLIAGGRDKGSDYRVLRKTVKERVRDLILIGESKEKIANSVNGVRPIHFADNLDQAVKSAYGLAKRGDIVLLSPICSSFDMFHDYKERGEVFRKAISNLRLALCEDSKQPKVHQHKIYQDTK